MELSEQFYGKMQLASWITEKYSQDEIKKLIDRIPYEDTRKVLTPHFWTIGPREGKAGIWLYCQTEDKDYYNVNRQIASITYKDNLIIVMDYDLVSYLLEKRCSASSLGRKLDYFLRGDFTDIPPIHMDDLYEMLYEMKGVK